MKKSTIIIIILLAILILIGGILILKRPSSKETKTDKELNAIENAVQQELQQSEITSIDTSDLESENGENLIDKAFEDEEEEVNLGDLI